MIRLDEKQYRAVKKMTRAACANNDCGNCLLLDDGETCVCVQSISYSLLCRYFREAVLPADRQLCEQITRSGETDLKRCAVCGSTFAAGSNRAKYCPDCAAKIRRRQKAQQALSDTVQDTLQMLVDADKRIYGDVTGKTLEAIAAQGYSYKDGQLEKQQPEATPDSLLTGETVRTPRGNFHITDMSREQIEAAGFGFHHASEDGKYLIMGNGTQAYAIAAEQPQRDNPLKHVEDTIEQNDNNFDGLINNTPQTPTVADFEQRAKAGEAISVTDLAKAVKAEKREQPQKKPSILKKLDEYKKQAAQQPKDKQKEHKKDLEV
ncbi:hypothetical protein HMPREF0988_02878 [Lachnospiraceae bacterium 1_4_56FAA]|nr:hypothetical protein HMPREF0988_02878 [Lachnospiraceae bacterium 1_4_56FAA]